ncbi:MAG: Hsp20/alpha crystallin family protein [Planctomycetales bacterium]|nr:Hsp20/alpha crystallin family protein [Planctomycetales bacterium]MCA9169578.1 Hsp20/alpha crystallin family protein [Planctomycetales bacterium]
MKTALTPRTTRSPLAFGDIQRGLEDWFRHMWDEEPTREMLAELTPRIDLAETDKEYEVSVELPGMKPEEINVELHGDTLTISGERKEESKSQDKTFHRVERRYGSFRRVIGLPDAGDPGSVTAACKDGVLNVVVPKATVSRPTKVKVT